MMERIEIEGEKARIMRLIEKLTVMLADTTLMDDDAEEWFINMHKYINTRKKIL